MSELSPPAEDLAALLIRMCQLPWPTTEEDRRRYFCDLQLSDGEVIHMNSHQSDPETRWRCFTTALPGQVEGTCTMFRDQFLGLYLSAYNQHEPHGQPATEGWALVRYLLSQVLGDPLEEWGAADNPACLWQPGVLTLDMYCSQTPSSGIMVGPCHTQRSAANDAAALQRGQTRPRMPDRQGGSDRA